MDSTVSPQPPSDIPRVLFVNKKQEETISLTRGIPVEVIHTEHLETARERMAAEPLHGIFLDVGAAKPSDISEIQGKAKGSKVPIFVLAKLSEITLAIDYVKHGAQGFLVKGLSDSDSLLKLMHYATSQHKF